MWGTVAVVLVVVAVLGFVVVQVLRSDPIPSGDTTPQGEAPSPGAATAVVPLRRPDTRSGTQVGP